MNRRLPLPATTLLLAVGVFGMAAAHAQVYRSVDAQGNVSFSDQPPVPDPKATGTPESSGTAAVANATPLPYELGRVQARYPVTLYSSAECAPCDSGRRLLTERGIPFAEKTVNDQEDVDALRQISDATELPILHIGQKQIRGYEQGVWTRYLDAAGYPKTSQLPRNWQASVATPLAAPTLAAETAADDASAEAAEVVQDGAEDDAIHPSITAENPTGIRF